MYSRIAGVLFLMVLGTAGLNAQADSALNVLNPLGTGPSGIRIQGASFFLTHSSWPEGNGGGFGTSIGTITEVGGSTTISYARSQGRSELSFSYTPSYTEQFQDFRTTSTNHTLSLNWNRHLTPRLTFSISIQGSLASVTETGFFSVNPNGNTPVTPVGNSSDPSTNAGTASQAVSAGITSLPLNSPAALLIYGQRSLLTSIQTSATYAYSSRLTFHALAGANRAQNLKDSTTTENNYLIAHTTGTSAGVGMNYMLNQRTSVGLDFTTFRAISNLTDSYSNSASVSLTRQIGSRWVVQGQGGIGFVVFNRELNYIPQGPQYQAGGSVGYKIGSHVFFVSTSRSFFDSYALGASGALTTSGAWTWTPGRHSWSISGSVGDQHLTGAGFQNVTSWQATASLDRRLSRQFNVSTQYAYLSGLGFIGGGQSAGGQHLLRLSVNWTPHGLGL